eukprot:scaffold4682_cov154-Pinguiococcus_pyrenoidosus.AAC.3
MENSQVAPNARRMELVRYAMGTEHGNLSSLSMVPETISFLRFPHAPKVKFHDNALRTEAPALRRTTSNPNRVLHIVLLPILAYAAADTHAACLLQTFRSRASLTVSKAIDQAYEPF